ncbi:MAG: 2,3-bisphosphoglycerate-dependent phosphoglycerate mutase [Simkaniaceae bacterium]|nr:2,3-bisphosphoglycerate-dependent phosphoglycerate mutase [Simkaniaceae bacterium]MCF7852575.1 2,3-bisphosphoglycerate-dependent phosphoglycerate mutase [Simkaniaceae bacterium]
MKKAILVLLRHGQSVWNKKNLFTGWIDVPLSPEGIEEAIKAGHQINQIDFAAVFTSVLIRAQTTATLAMSVHTHERVLAFQHDDPMMKKNARVYSENAKEQLIPVFTSWHLNERMYGSLQGMDKDEARARFGKEQVQIWRRSFDVAPPEGESLEMTMERTLPYFEEHILPYLKRGENVLISAHGNSLRSIVYAIEGMTKEEILHFEIPTGMPLYYEYANDRYEKRG